MLFAFFSELFFLFQPKEDLKVTANVPAIQMEEILPIAVSKGDTLAPQEVYAHKKAATRVCEGENLIAFVDTKSINLQGESELTHEDRKRKRRKMKESFKKKEKEKEHRKRVREAVEPGTKKAPSEKEVLSTIKKSKVRYWLMGGRDDVCFDAPSC